MPCVYKRSPGARISSCGDINMHVRGYGGIYFSTVDVPDFNLCGKYIFLLYYGSIAEMELLPSGWANRVTRVV